RPFRSSARSGEKQSNRQGRASRCRAYPTASFSRARSERVEGRSRRLLGSCVLERRSRHVAVRRRSAWTRSEEALGSYEEKKKPAGGGFPIRLRFGKPRG